MIYPTELNLRRIPGVIRYRMYTLVYVIVGGGALGLLSGLIADSRDGKTAWKYAMALLLVFALMAKYGR